MRRRRVVRHRRGRSALPKLVPGTRVRFGQEKTPAECRARAKWERKTASEVAKLPYGDIMAPGHIRTAEAYERLAPMRNRRHIRRARAFGQRQAETTPEFDAALDRYVANAQAVLDAHLARMYMSRTPENPDFGAQKLSIERGPRYIRIVRADVHGPSRSVHSFIDTRNGDILKAASYKTPAKHARGNIFKDPGEAITPHGGVRYLR
jgi:hypothetical protein